MASQNGFEGIAECTDCNADIYSTIKQLVAPENTTTLSKKGPTLLASKCSVEWTTEEESHYHNILAAFLKNDKENTLSFPKGMGSRKRKIVHFVAEDLRLRHWSEGKRDAEKIVAVGKRYN